MEIVRKTQQDINYDTIMIPFAKDLKLAAPISEYIQNSVTAAVKAGLFNGEKSEI